MVFDDTLPNVDECMFSTHDWSSFYPDATEQKPINAPVPRGKSNQYVMFL